MNLFRRVMVGLVWAVGTGLGAAPAARPNLLWIVADDLNPMIGAMGDRQARTPNLDRLARRGTLLRNAYASWTSCLPSRASFLSGWQPARAPIGDWGEHHSRRGAYAAAVYLPEHFKAHGYFTGRLDKIFHIGKDDAASWSLTEEPWRDAGGVFRAISTPRELATLQLEKKVIRQGVFPQVTGETGTFAVLEAGDDEFFDGQNSRRAREILRDRARAGGPFLLAVGFRRPHLPWIAPRKYFESFPPERIELPPRAADGDRPPVDEALNRTMIAHYLAAVAYFDVRLGEVLGELEALGLAASTIVAVHGDHGYLLGERGGRFGKGTLWERSVHTPLVLAGPGILAGAARTEPVSLLDLYPTFVDLAGLPAPATPLDGRSLGRLLRTGADPEWRGHAVSFSGGANGRLAASLRTARYRYTENAERRPVELVDLAADPYERQNLVGRPEFAAVQAELQARLAQEWQAGSAAAAGAAR
jgi:arylsulfatase A-like enzyme